LPEISREKEIIKTIFGRKRKSMEPLRFLARTRLAILYALAITLIVVTGISPASAQKGNPYTYVSVDYPDAIATTASGNNNLNVIVGDYTDGNEVMHGYVRSASGSFTSVDYPGATATSLWGINDSGKAVGYYADANGNTHGFSFVPPSTFASIDYPSAIFTVAYGINNSGQIVGTWVDSTGTIQSGFSLVNGVFTSLTYPNAASTLASGINSAGNICGAWYDNNGTSHGFTLTTAIDGVYTDFDAPGASMTGADRINDSFQIGGYTTDSSGNFHGLLAAPEQNQYIAINYPNSIATIVRGLNNQPVMVGHYTDTNQVEHGFYAMQGSASFILTVSTLGTGNGTVTDNFQEIDCVDTNGVQSGLCAASYGSGTTVNLTATPQQPTTFGGWGGVCSGTGGCSVVMNSNQAVTAAFVPPPATMSAPFTCPNDVYPCTNVTAPPAVFNCPSGLNPCPDPNAHSLTLTAPQVNTAFTMTVAATEVPMTQADGDCQFGETPATDFDCRFTSFFPYETLNNGDVIVPACDAYSNGNCVFYSVYFGDRGVEPPNGDYEGPIAWSIAWNNTSFLPNPNYPYQINNPRLYDDPDEEVSRTAPYGTNCETPMLINGNPTNPPIYCQFVFDITTYFDPNQPPDAGIGGKTKHFNDVVVAFPLNNAAPSLSVAKTADNPTVNAGNPIGYTITMSNGAAPGTGSATNAALSDPLPAGTNINWSISPPYTGPGTCSIMGTPPSQTLACMLGNISPAITAKVHVASSNSSAGTYVNTATFSASNSGPQTASATIQVIGAGPIARVFPAMVNFHTVYLTQTADADVTLANTGDAAMTVGPITISAPGNDLDDFVVNSSCPSHLAAGKTCKIMVTFTASGENYSPTATLSIADNAPGSPQSVPLSATVINPQATFKPDVLHFGSQTAGTTSPPKTVTLTNTGTTDLILRKISITGNFGFAPGGTCSEFSSLAPKAQCTMNVTFSPVGKGRRIGCVTVNDNTILRKHKVDLSGVGD
jgi:uncharacterized repeat protein (TIGR01451 family)